MGRDFRKVVVSAVFSKARQLKLRATQSKTGLRRLEVQSAQADFAVCCPQFQLPGLQRIGFAPCFTRRNT